jgi:hypothetical protein
VRPATFFSALAATAAIGGESAATPAPRHPRAVFAANGAERSPAVLVHDDGAWVPSPQVTGGAREVCSPAGRCAPIIHRRPCATPECPADGWLLVTAWALGRSGDLPAREAPWRAEVERIRADPALRPLVPSALDYPRPRLRPWVERCYATFPELDLGAAGGTLLEEGQALGGVAAHVGWRMTDCPEVDTTGSDLFRDLVFGEYWGADLRLRYFRLLESPGEPAALFTVGIGPALYNLAGTETGASRWRVPTVAGVVLPEVGAAIRTDASPSLYLAWSAPVAVLIRQGSGWILQLTPTFGIMYHTPLGHPDAWLTLALQVVVR